MKKVVPILTLAGTRPPLISETNLYELSDVMGGWGIWETVNGERELTTECIENVIMMVPFSAVVAWTFGEKIGISWKRILWQSGKIAFGFSLMIAEVTISSSVTSTDK